MTNAVLLDTSVVIDADEFDFEALVDVVPVKRSG